MKQIRTPFLLLLLCSIWSVQTTHAQRLGANSKSKFSDSLNLILAGYGNNFWSIQGAPIDTDNDPATYQSRYTLPGSSGAVITRYSSVQDSSASWQAVVFESDEFNDAAKAYRKWVQDLKSTRVKCLTGNAQFSGDFEKPDESLRFTTTGLTLKTNDLQYQQLYAEVSLLNNMAQWQIQISFYRRKIEASPED